ncbi:Protocadherin-1 [Cricetulus griseus]|uniref:Protocadherin-1 n=1 Tax=Cricetulus griseus TaxID=10029 RepID=G3HYD5_CRIGR|nr:Protocadherin-1 [Cricetulus griseus]
MGPLRPSPGPGGQQLLLPPLLLALMLLLAPAAGHTTQVVYKVPEEQPPNTLIGSLAADYGFPDVGHLYKLEVGAPYLRVDGKTGDIFTTETSIDREGLRECQNHPKKPCILEFEVSITDLVQNVKPRLVEGQIEVQDINDNTPNFASPVITLAIPENTNIGSLFPIPLATDRDAGPNGVASYELQAGPEARLEVGEDQEEKQPQLIVMGNLDRERWDSYDLSIKVQDGGNPPRASSALLRVTVLDTNDNAPKFERPSYEAELSENSPIGHSVIQGMVTVIDGDKGENAQVQLSVEQDNGDFVIQNGTGTILSSLSFDREQQSTYTFQLKAVDGGVPPRSAYVGVTINVLDENDNAPFITAPSNTSHRLLTPQTRLGETVSQVTAEDIDSGVNAELTYSIAGGNPYGLFQIGSHSGAITLEKEIERRHHGLHRLVVKVSDRGKPPRYGTALVHLYVNETLANRTLLETLLVHSLDTPLDIDIAGDPEYERSKQRGNILFGVVAGVVAVALLIALAVLVRYCRQREAKSGYQAGKKETKDLYAPKPSGKAAKGNKSKGKKSKSPKPVKPVEDEDEAGLQKSLKFNLMSDAPGDSPRIHLPLNYPPGSPDLGRHYRSNSPLPSIQLQPQSPSASKKHQVVQDLPPANTFVGTGDTTSTGSEQYSDYSYRTNPPKYPSKQLPHRRVTFSATSQAQELQDPSQHSYYDSGLEESETPSSKSSSGPRLGPLALPEDHYERTTPDGSIGEMEHPENGEERQPV